MPTTSIRIPLRIAVCARSGSITTGISVHVQAVKNRTSASFAGLTRDASRCRPGGAGLPLVVRAEPRRAVQPLRDVAQLMEGHLGNDVPGTEL